MTLEPLVSIGLPVYNGERWIRACLDSLLGQTYRNLELVVCDNASTDRTASICAEYAGQDSRVRYFRNERNLGTRGPRGNFCRVLFHSTGDYFMWASADDWRDPAVIEHCMREVARNPRAVLVHGAVELVFPDGRQGELSNDADLAAPSASERVRAFTAGIQHNAMIYGLFRRESLAKTRYGNHYGHDYLVCLQACLLGPVERIQSPLIRYRQRNDSLDLVMYPFVPVSMTDLLMYRGVRRYKCAMTLVMGAWYLLTLDSVPSLARIRGAAVFARTFVSRYRRHLATEMLFLLATPTAWLFAPLQPVAVKVKAALKRRGLFAS